jgi:nucleoside phosphorylase
MIRRLCLVTAAEIEFRIAASLLSTPITTVEEDLQITRSANITLLKTEIGALGFSDKFNHHLKTNRYAAVLIAGFGGALDPQCRRNEAVVYERCLSALDGSSVACDRGLSQRINAAVGAQQGIGLTTKRVIVDARAKRDLNVKFGAMVVDMESYEVLVVCERHKIPAAVLRVISDEAEEELPDFNRILQPDGKIDNRKVLGALLGRPRASWQFLRSMKPTGEALKAALKLVLSDLTELHSDEG